jgi:hypothetical protein
MSCPSRELNPARPARIPSLGRLSYGILFQNEEGLRIMWLSFSSFLIFFFKFILDMFTPTITTAIRNASIN